MSCTPRCEYYLTCVSMHKNTNKVTHYKSRSHLSIIYQYIYVCTYVCTLCSGRHICSDELFTYLHGYLTYLIAELANIHKFKKRELLSRHLMNTVSHLIKPLTFIWAVLCKCRDKSIGFYYGIKFDFLKAFTHLIKIQWINGSMQAT